MKSLKFTHLYEKLVNREKFRTFRTLYVPNIKVGEVINIDFEFKKELGWNINKIKQALTKYGLSKRKIRLNERVTLYIGKILDIYPKRILDVNQEEARLDGFKSEKAFVKGIIEINKVRFVEHWGFFYVWKEREDILERYL